MTEPARTPALNCQEAVRDPDAVPATPQYPHELSTGRGSTIIVVDTGVGIAGATGDRDACILHGSAVATTARSTAPGAHIHSIKHSERPDTVTGTVEELVSALHKANRVRAQHKIVNISMVTCESTPELESVIREMIFANTLVVASIGNLGQCDPGAPTYPASLPGVLSVGAVEATSTGHDANPTPEEGAGGQGLGPAPAMLNQGRVPAEYGMEAVAADLYAPGGPVVADLGRAPVTGSPEPFIGTSFATPVVSGTAALLWQLAPQSTAAEVRLTLQNTAQPAGTILGVEGQHTALVVDPAAALGQVRDQHRSELPAVQGTAHMAGHVTASPIAAEPVDYRVPLGLSAFLALALVLVMVARALASDKTPPSGKPEITRHGTL